jgi:hypothetical protein
MYLHIGDGLVSGCLTSVGCLHDISFLGRWRSLDNLVTFYMMATWSLLGECPALERSFSILEEGIGP